MFTGIITDLGSVTAIEKQGETAFTLRTGFPMQEVAIGASIACDGCCLTVVEKGTDWFKLQVSEESLARTTLGGWKTGTRVNLERALKAGDELGGHLVSGHVDGVAAVESIEDSRESRIIWLSAPQEFAKYIAPKGSVTLNGVSLTVNNVQNNWFSINVIPHTLKVTNLGALKIGDRLNLEIDLIARYLARLKACS
jgi:riboflavin synthase